MVKNNRIDLRISNEDKINLDMICKNNNCNLTELIELFARGNFIRLDNKLRDLLYGYNLNSNGVLNKNENKETVNFKNG